MSGFLIKWIAIVTGLTLKTLIWNSVDRYKTGW